MIVQNDCVGIDVDNRKSSFTKSLTLQMKSGDTYYPGAVAPGDWVVAWMHEDQSQIDKIVSYLQNLSIAQRGLSSDFGKYHADSGLNTWSSGMKFVGRVSSVGAADVMPGAGQRTVTQRIDAEAFLELSSTIYFTYLASAVFLAPLPSGSNLNDQTSVSALNFYNLQNTP
jgi:hypothetical protein